MSDYDYPSQNHTPLLGPNDLPLRLFTQNGQPVTDVEGNLLFSVLGQPLATVDPRRGIFLDAKGQRLTDAAGTEAGSLEFDPTRQPAETWDERPLTTHAPLFDMSGNPVTDEKCRPLVHRDGKIRLIFGPRGELIGDSEGRLILDRLGRSIINDRGPLFDQRTGKILRIFDEQSRPLTDAQGFELPDLTGLALFTKDRNGYPVRHLTGGSLYDCFGISREDSTCDFTQEPNENTVGERIITSTGFPAVAFDFQGHPVTDLSGLPLCQSSGVPLAIRNDGIWIDTIHWKPLIIIRKNVFHNYSLNGYKNSNFVPLRLFDECGWPLTDVNGTPQRHANGQCLILFNEEGDPVSTFDHKPYIDFRGRKLGDPHFQPCSSIKSTIVSDRIKTIKQTYCQYFNRFGYPLTNSHGVPLLDIDERFTLSLDSQNHPIFDEPIFDIHGLPILRSYIEPLSAPTGIPIRLYNNDGKPLTNHRGTILRNVNGHPVVMLDENGKVKHWTKYGEIFDAKLCSPRRVLEFNASGDCHIEENIDRVSTTTGESLRLFDLGGFPLTDSEGVLLLDNRGRSLIRCLPGKMLQTFDGQPVYDIKGNCCIRSLLGKHVKSPIMFDQYSRPLTDQNGNTLKTRKGSNLVVYKSGVPYDVIYGGGIYDFWGKSLNDPTGDPNYFFPRESNIIADCQLFDNEDLPLTDAVGCALYSSTGVSLVELDFKGKVKCDYLGRAVFDSVGVPLTKSCGLWKNQQGKAYRLFTEDGFPLTDYRGKTLMDRKENPLIRKDKYGRPYYDWLGRLVRDHRSNTIQSGLFDPLERQERSVVLLELDGSPLRIYSVEDLPLTDQQGRLLYNSKLKPLLDMKRGLSKLKDRENRLVFDVWGRPFGCDPTRPMISMTGQPLRLYNETGKTLTDANGLVISENGISLISFDKYGRPTSSRKGKMLYDSMGHVWFDQKAENIVNE